MPVDMILNEHCDAGYGHSEALQLALMNPKPVAVIGTDCSGAATAAGLVSNQYQLPFITPSASSMLLDDRSQYLYFLRTQQSLGPDTVVTLQLIKHYGWGRVAILGTNDAYS